MRCVKRSKRAFQVYRLSILSAQFSIYISTTASLALSSNPCLGSLKEKGLMKKRKEKFLPREKIKYRPSSAYALIKREEKRPGFAPLINSG